MMTLVDLLHVARSIARSVKGDDDFHITVSAEAGNAQRHTAGKDLSPTEFTYRIYCNWPHSDSVTNYPSTDAALKAFATMLGTEFGEPDDIGIDATAKTETSGNTA